MANDFRVRGLDHVAVTTPEEMAEEVVSWYRECLALAQIDKPEGTRPQGAWFDAGGQGVHVTVDEHNPHKTAHFGLVVDDFEGIVERLRASGCHIEQASQLPGRRRFYTRDPAGNRIEILTFVDDAAGNPG